MNSITIAGIIAVITFVLFILDIFPIGITALASALAMAFFGIISFKSAFVSMGDDIIFLVIGMGIIGRSLFKNKIAEYVGVFLTKYFAKSEKIFLIVSMIIIATISAFLSNVATLAMFIPIVASVAAASGGKITKKNSLLPLCLATGVGGTSTLIGSPPQIIAQAMLKSGGYAPIKFFDLAYIGIPMLIVLILYFITLGNKISRKVLKYDDVLDVAVANDTISIVDPHLKRKQIITSIVMLLTIIGFMAQIWTLGTVAMIGAIICIITGCLSDKEAYASIDWSTLLVITGAFGFAKGLNDSGLCEWIAKFILNIVGTNAKPFVIFAVLIFIAMVLTNMASNTSIVTIMTPIGITIATALNVSVTSVVLGIIVGSSLAYCTPIGAPINTMILDPGGYKFSDYIKIGGIFNILAYLVAIIIVPIVFPL